MIYSVKLTELARKDLRGIYEYFAFTRLEPRFARKIKQRIVDKLKSLNEMPHRYPVYQEEPWKSRGLRQVGIGGYCCFYFVREKSVEVIRIMYGDRDISAALLE